MVVGVIDPGFRVGTEEELQNHSLKVGMYVGLGASALSYIISGFTGGLSELANPIDDLAFSGIPSGVLTATGTYLANRFSHKIEGQYLPYLAGGGAGLATLLLGGDLSWAAFNAGVSGIGTGLLNNNFSGKPLFQ